MYRCDGELYVEQATAMETGERPHALQKLLQCSVWKATASTVVGSKPAFAFEKCMEILCPEDLKEKPAD